MFSASRDILDGRFDELVAAIFVSENHVEGRKAFLEKRKPILRGNWNLAPEPASVPCLGTAALATAALYGVGGFAAALMMAISIASAVGMKAAIPTVAAATIVRHASRVRLFGNAADRPPFRAVFLSALPFIIAGVGFCVELPEAAVSLCLDALLIGRLPIRRFLTGRRVTIARAALAGVAVPSCFLCGASFGVLMMLGAFLWGPDWRGKPRSGRLRCWSFSRIS